MVIDINGIPPGSGGTGKNRETNGTNAASPAKKEAPPAPPSNESNKGETVSVSDQAKALQKLEDSLKNDTDSNSERVAAIKAAVEEGTYEVNANSLAQKMLDFEKGIF